MGQGRVGIRDTLERGGEERDGGSWKVCTGPSELLQIKKAAYLRRTSGQVGGVIPQ